MFREGESLGETLLRPKSAAADRPHGREFLDNSQFRCRRLPPGWRRCSQGGGAQPFTGSTPCLVARDLLHRRRSALMANWEKGGTGQCGMGRGSSPSTSATSIVISSQPLKPSPASPSHYHFQYQFYVERCSTSLCNIA